MYKDPGYYLDLLYDRMGFDPPKLCEMPSPVAVWKQVELLLRQHEVGLPFDPNFKKIGRSRIALQIDSYLWHQTHRPARYSHHLFGDGEHSSDRDIMKNNLNDFVLDGLSKDIWYGIALKKHAVFCGPPSVLKKDPQNRLHATTGPAISWRGDLTLYSLHGTTVSERIACYTDELSRDEVLEIDNAEILRSVRDALGAKRFAELLDIVEVHRDEYGILWRTREPLSLVGSRWRPEYLQWLEVKDATDQRVYFLGINPTIKTAREAAASTFRLRASEYILDQES
jgi:hypothetical protein